MGGPADGALFLKANLLNPLVLWPVSFVSVYFIIKMAFFRDKCPMPEVPKYMDFVDFFPMNAAGKMLKYK